MLLCKRRRGGAASSVAEKFQKISKNFKFFFQILQYLDCANGGTAAMVAVVTTVAAEKFIFFKFNNFSVLLCKRQRGGATSLVAEKFQIFFNQIFQY